MEEQVNVGDFGPGQHVINGRDLEINGLDITVGSISAQQIADMQASGANVAVGGAERVGKTCDLVGPAPRDEWSHWDDDVDAP